MLLLGWLAGSIQDLTARGVDLEHVNVVVSLSLPAEGATLMHRAGRTGRFGTVGLALTLLTQEELPTLQVRRRRCTNEVQLVSQW